MGEAGECKAGLNVHQGGIVMCTGNSCAAEMLLCNSVARVCHCGRGFVYCNHAGNRRSCTDEFVKAVGACCAQLLGDVRECRVFGPAPRSRCSGKDKAVQLGAQPAWAKRRAPTT